MNETSRFHQRGIGSFTLLINILFFAGLISLGLKMWSPFYDNTVIAGVMQDIVQEEDLTRLSNHSIRGRLGLRLDMNGIRNFDLKQFKITRREGKVKLEIAYSVEKPLIGDLYLLGKFEEVAVTK